MLSIMKKSCSNFDSLKKMSVISISCFLCALIIQNSIFASTTQNKTLSTLDLEKTVILWAGSKPGATHTGTLKVKEANLSGSLETKLKGKLLIDMNSLQVTDLSGESAESLKGHLLSEDFFHVSQYPQASLDITSFDSKGKLVGQLTIRGSTKPIEITMQQSKEDTSLWTGRIQLDRTQYGMNFKSKNFFKNLGQKFIEDNVAIDIQAYLK